MRSKIIGPIRDNLWRELYFFWGPELVPHIEVLDVQVGKADSDIPVFNFSLTVTPTLSAAPTDAQSLQLLVGRLLYRPLSNALNLRHA
jgi:hypothetical protein